VGGVYYQHGIYNMDQPSFVGIYLPFPPFFGVINGAPTPTIIETSADDYGVFGNATYTVVPGLRLIGGLRYTYSDVSEHDTHLEDAPTPQFTSVNASDVTFRAGVQYDLAAHTMAYFTASSGFKAPEINDSLIAGANPKAPPGTVELFGIKPEKPLDYEAGIKTSLFGGRLNVDGDGFYTTVTDFQTQSCVPDPTVGIICGDINVPSVVTKGFEAEVFGRPTPTTTVNLSGIYDDATYPKGFQGADSTNLGGQQLNDDPKWKFTASVEQEFPINDDYKLSLGVDVTYKASQSLYLSSLPFYRIGDETLLNARLTLASARNWTVSLFGRNLTNAIYPTSYYPTQAFQPGGNWQTLDPNSRRIAGVQAEYKF
jgi:iron complex outermembrane receptor protein